MLVKFDFQKSPCNRWILGAGGKGQGAGTKGIGATRAGKVERRGIWAERGGPLGAVGGSGGGLGAVGQLGVLIGFEGIRVLFVFSWVFELVTIYLVMRSFLEVLFVVFLVNFGLLD